MEWVMIGFGVLILVVSYVLIYRAQGKSSVAGMRGTGGLENLDVPAWYRYLAMLGLAVVVAGVVWMFV